MSRRSRPIAALLGAALLVGVTGTGAAGAAPAGPTRAAAVTPSPFTLDWARPVVDRQNISTSSPVVVDNGGDPFVVTGDLGGNLRAFRLHDGAPRAGWGAVDTGYELRAPLSSDGTNVYVPVSQDGKDQRPRFEKYRADGTLAWNTNPGAPFPAPGKGFLLAGMSLARVDGTWRAYGASSGHWIYAFDGATGAFQWDFRNADSTMATPAVADLFGTGQPQIITSNDKSAETPADRNGGHLRIFDTAGRQICSADQTVTGNTYASSGYNNSSPIVGAVAGQPLIVFGSTGPVQYGAGGNQVVAYNSNCERRWSTPALVGQVVPSPTFADVLGDATPEVIQVIGAVDGSVKYPRVYVIDAATGAILRDSGTSLRSHGNANLAYTPATSVTSADIDADGKQELFVPSSSLLVLEGDLSLRQAIPLGGSVTQATPVITDEPGGGLRVTVAGYSGNNGNGVFGGTIRSYTTPTGSLGARGWPRFGHDAQLTGLVDPLDGPYDTLLEGGTLEPGESLRSRSNGFTATMDPGGAFTVRWADGGVLWTTGTTVAGSRLVVGTDGEVRVVDPGGVVRWRSGARGGVGAVERLLLGNDGFLRSLTTTFSGTERTAVTTKIWTSDPKAAAATVDRIVRGQTLRVGQSLTSPNGTYRVSMQSDGNLVLYNRTRALWQTGTRAATGTAYLAFQGSDANLVLYGPGRVLKNFAVNGRNGATLLMQNDGVLRLATAGGATVWATNTRGK